MPRVPRQSMTYVVAAQLVCFALAGLAIACNPDESAAPAPGGRPDHALLAKAPGNPTVNSTTPDSASQGTTIDVHVFGTGFTDGAAATWQRNGVANPNKVKTNSTQVISSTELVANITIADTADVASWDVQVALVGGKKGIGTELFTVTPKVPPPQQTTGTTSSGARWEFGTLGTSIDPAGNVTLHPAGIFGDNRDVDGNDFGASPPTDSIVGVVSGAYENAHCGQALPIYWWGAFQATGDATFDPSVSTFPCRPRPYRIVFDGATLAPTQFLLNARRVMQVAVGSPTRMVTWFRVSQPNCTRLAIGTLAADGVSAATGGIRITRLASAPPTSHLLSQHPGYVPGQWLVESVDGVGTCENLKGQRWIPGTTRTGLYFRIHITEIPPTL